MKQTKHLLLLAALLHCIATNAHDFEADGIYYNIISFTEETVEVTYQGEQYDSYDEYNGTVIIPETVAPYRVIKIGANAFRGCDNLTSITIPEGVTSIGESAFSNCSSLTSITIPESVTEIGSNAFYGCNGLTAVHISSLEDWCKISFGDSDANPLAYAHNLYLNGELVTELVIPEGITKIGSYAFSGCSSLTSVAIPEGITEIGGGAFYECSSLTSITIPESVTKIENYAFYGCSGLTSITIPESVTEIGSNAFFGCNGLTAVHISSLEDWCKISFGDSDANPLAYAHNLYLNGELVTELVIPEGITKIGSYAFSGCSSLTSVAIPEGITEIGGRAFYECSSLTSITIPESVTEIGSCAFFGCYRLTAITIPESVTEIGGGAFYGCTGLTSITSRAITPPRCATNTFKFVDTTIPVNVPQGSVADYQAAGIWKDFSTFIEFDPTEIESITTNETKAPIYNLKGIRVSVNRDTLPAGMYIQNGKKFVVM